MDFLAASGSSAKILAVILSRYWFNLVGDERNKNVTHFYSRDDARGEATLSRYGFRFEEKGEYAPSGYVGPLAQNNLDVRNKPFFYIASGYRDTWSGSMCEVNAYGENWSATTMDVETETIYFEIGSIIAPTRVGIRNYGFSLRS